MYRDGAGKHHGQALAAAPRPSRRRRIAGHESPAPDRARPARRRALRASRASASSGTRRTAHPRSHGCARSVGGAIGRARGESPRSPRPDRRRRSARLFDARPELTGVTHARRRHEPQQCNRLGDAGGRHGHATLWKPKPSAASPGPKASATPSSIGGCPSNSRLIPRATPPGRRVQDAGRARPRRGSTAPRHGPPSSRSPRPRGRRSRPGRNQDRLSRQRFGRAPRPTGALRSRYR